MRGIRIVVAALLLAVQAVPAVAAAPAAAVEQQNPRLKFQGKVDIYITSWCGYCRKTEAWLQENKVPYNRYDIEADAEAKNRFEQQGGRGVPLVLIGPAKINGYSPERMSELLFK